MGIWRLQNMMVNQATANLIMNPKPPTLYSIMNSIANYDAEEKTKIRNLASATRERIFDFDYTLSSAITKSDFETDILNHFIMRRIGQETFTAFQIFLENKLHEILPYYNVLFDALNNYKLFDDGEVITRDLTDNKSSSESGNNSQTVSITNSGTNNTDERFSEYPLNQLSDITSGTYVSNQRTNNNTISGSSSQGTQGANSSSKTDSDALHETISRSPHEKMNLYKQYLETKSSIMSMIYKELEILFYGIGE